MTVRDRARPARLVAGAAAVAVLAAGLAGCSASADTTQTAAAATAGASGLFDSSQVQSIALELDEADYQAMLQTFAKTGDKEWIRATVTVNGEAFHDVGIKLKGNSSLQGLAATVDGASADQATTDQADTAGGAAAARGPGGDVSADEPEGLPWRIRLDKYVAGQSYHGETDFVVRANRSESSLNEAVALELIGAAGLATQQAAATRFSVNGSREALRLVIENPDDDWAAATFDGAGVLYKAEAEGDYSDRGDDAAAYADAFEIEAGDDDYAPLIEFLDFVDNADDDTFAADLDEHLDVGAFATYLAIQDLVANNDDIDGPGNNSYLRYDSGTGRFTVVSWDQNLSFGGLGGPGAGGPAGDGLGGRRPGAPAPAAAGQATPDALAVPSGAAAPGAPATPGQPAPAEARPGGRVGGPRGGNVLAERFRANSDFAAVVDKAKQRLQRDLYDSGKAQQILDTWVAVLSNQAADLVSADTLEREAAEIAGYFTSSS